MISRARTVLGDVFGYDEFRPLQREIIGNVLKKRDSLVVMPTGGGNRFVIKSPPLFLRA